MNQSYFENRIDRYILFKNSSKLTEFLICLTDNLKQIYTEYGKKEPDATNFDERFEKFYKESSDFNFDDSKYIYIYPCIQMSKHGVDQDLKFIQAIFSKLPMIIEKASASILCTSYFNLTDWLREAILKTEANWKLLTSSPESNSFHNSNGFGSYIPKFYQFNLHSMFIDSRKNNNNIEAYEFKSNGLTFHAKGRLILYNFLLKEIIGFLIHTNDSGILSTIGSPNFGARSEIRDNELQFYIFSKNSFFNSQLKKVTKYLVRRFYLCFYF